MESISQLWQTPMRLWRKIWRSEQSTLRSVTLLLSGSALSQALPILVSPIVTRLYSPADFGVFAIFSTVLGLIGPIANLRYDLSIVMPDDETKAVELAAIGIYVAALLSLFLQAVEPAAASLLVTHFGYSSAARLLLLVPIGVFLTGCYQVLSMLALRHRAYGVVASTRMQQGIGSSAAQLAAGFLKIGPAGLAISTIISQSAGIFSLLRKVKQVKILRGMLLAPRRLLGTAREYAAYPLWSSQSSLLTAVSSSLPAGMIALVLGTTSAGYFMLSQRIMGIPLSLLGNAVAQVYLAEASRWARSSSNLLKQRFWTTAKWLFLIGVVVIVPVAILAQPLVPILFGARWKPAAQYFGIMAPLFLAQFTNSPLSQTLAILGKLRLQLALDIMRLVAMAIVFTWFAVGHPDPLRAIGVYSLVMTLCYCAYFTTYGVCVGKNALQVE